MYEGPLSDATWPVLGAQHLLKASTPMEARGCHVGGFTAADRWALGCTSRGVGFGDQRVARGGGR